jgi:hypothetical protein
MVIMKAVEGKVLLGDMKKTKTIIKWKGLAILNAYDAPWSKKVFETVGEAERYTEVFWSGMKIRPICQSMVLFL